MYFWTAFILGLAGSIHCAGMCGPLALSLPATGRSFADLLCGRVVYNLGRVATYCLLGLVFGLTGQTLMLAGAQRWLSIGLGVVLLTGLIAARYPALWRPGTTLMGRLKCAVSCQLRRRSVTPLGVVGSLNGLLPCGLVYVACAGAIGTGNIFSGVEYMALFGAGTIPMMLGIGISRKLLPVTFRLRLRTAIPVSVVLLATLLVLRGLGLGIPYLSPALHSRSPACCR